jgi:hypothetical protein
MAEAINYTGKVDVKIQLAAGVGELKKFGESMDMVDVEDIAFFHDVPGDRYGGPQGPPIDTIWLGMMCRIRLELSRWDPDVWDALKKRQVSTTAGTLALADVGTLMLASNGFRLLLDSPTRPLNFPGCLLRDSVNFNMGTKFTTLSLQIEAHVCQLAWAANVLYDEDDVEYT